MSIEIPNLPYAMDALAPHISEETLTYHYGKHHVGYFNKLNNQLPGTDYENATLEDIINKAEGGMFNNAAQAWNHTFYWNSLSPNGGGTPTGRLAESINQSFGSFDQFKEDFTKAAASNFGSGWTWLVADDSGNLQIVNTSNADTPLRTAGMTPVLTCDVWEHAYYIDYRNNRGGYIDAFWALVNWQFAEENLA